MTVSVAVDIADAFAEIMVDEQDSAGVMGLEEDGVKGEEMPKRLRVDFRV